jgi:hydrogenase nickel incorporation protein HypA/HybF
MHETSLMKSLMRQIDTAAASEGAHRVVGVSVWVGALTNMSAEHFIEHFEHAAAGTIAEGARMEVTVSEDPQHRDALNVVLKGVEVEF